MMEKDKMDEQSETLSHTDNQSSNPSQPDFSAPAPKELMRELVEEDVEEHEESMRVGLLLTLGIGILNACTYVTRGHVFASSQSGNLLYLCLLYTSDAATILRV